LLNVILKSCKTRTAIKKKRVTSKKLVTRSLGNFSDIKTPKKWPLLNMPLLLHGYCIFNAFGFVDFWKAKAAKNAENKKGVDSQ